MLLLANYIERNVSYSKSTQNYMKKTRFVTIIFNCISAIGLFTYYFIPAWESIEMGISGLANTITNGIFSNPFETIEYCLYLAGIIGSQGPIVILVLGIVLLAGFLTSFIVGIMSLVFLINSMANYKNNPEKSQNNSIKSIKALITVYASRLICTLFFNIYVTLGASYPLNALQLAIPIPSLVFLIICIAEFIWLKHNEDVSIATSNSYYENNTSDYRINHNINQNVSLETMVVQKSEDKNWICMRCNSLNHKTNNSCYKCGAQKNNTNTCHDDNTSIWTCVKCGAYNSKDSIYCIECGEKHR